MKILNIDPYLYNEEAKKILRTVGEYTELDSPSVAILKEKICDVDILVMRLAHRIDKEIIDKAKNLKVIASNVTGVDHVDEKYANNCGIKIISLRGEYDFLSNVSASAEHTWALLMAHSRNLIESSHAIKNGVWNRNQFIGNELQKKSIGILGYGRNGKKIAKYAKAFDMVVCAYDIDTGQYDQNIDLKYSIDEIFEKCDIITINLPLNETTEGLLTRENFRLMKDTAVIINTSRGKILNENDLIECLMDGTIYGVALDVISNEFQNIEDNRLIKLAKSNNKILITPHIGGVTRESWARTEQFIAEKIKKWHQKYLNI